jgi:hypothetical protein
MASTERVPQHRAERLPARRPEPFQPRAGGADFGVSEFAADVPGALSPYGPEMQFPLPVTRLRYRHPGPADRPHLADGR